MKIFNYVILTLVTIISQNNFCYAQDTTQTCKVLLEMINGEYKGGCKKGLANGYGEAKAVNRYIGNFKNGLPNEKGTYYYADDVFYVGNFQDGLREGKGEMHYTKASQPDSVIKGYWSADVYRGKRYITYTTDALSRFDRVEISPSDQAGNYITIELSSTSNNPDGVGPLMLIDLISMRNNSLIKKVSDYQSPLKNSWVFQVTEFPITLRATVSNGQNFTMELYKAANWSCRFYLNK